MKLYELGWNKNLATEYARVCTKDQKPGRIVAEHKNIYKVICENSEFNAELSGRYWYDLQQTFGSKGDFPAVGDWVLVSYHEGADKAMIHDMLTRKSKFSRKVNVSGGRKLEKFEDITMIGGGRTEEQIIAANIDLTALVLSSAKKISIGLIDRFLTTVWESGADPMIILNKIDLDLNWQDKLKFVCEHSMNVPVIALSALNNFGVEDMNIYLEEGKTIALIGKSGVGKSTLINRLLGYERQKTDEVRVTDSKGKHTTTYRELILIPGKGLLMDTPGMRELQLWSNEESINRTFEDIETLITRCRFRNCMHNNETGCAIQQAIEEGSLLPEHYQNYLKQKREFRYLQKKKDQRERKISRLGKRSGKTYTANSNRVKK